MTRPPKIGADSDSAWESDPGERTRLSGASSSRSLDSIRKTRSSLPGRGETACPQVSSAAHPHNNILGSLPCEELNHLRPQLQRFPLSRGHLLFDAAAHIDSLYFPLDGMICLLAVMDDGRTVVLATTGREGFLGVPTLLGDETAPLRSVVLIEGTALKLSRDHLRRALPATPQFSAALRRYCSIYLSQVVQIGACHALHTVQQRVASWLLMVRDRSNTDSLPLTHESLSELLGCRRSSVTEVLSQFEVARLIAGSRGHISITDRRRLAEQACECYAVLRNRAALG